MLTAQTEDARRMLNGYRVASALVKIRGRVKLEDIEDSLFSSNVYKPTLVTANKMDLESPKKESHISRRF